MTDTRCGVQTNRGRPCHQVVDVLPCRYHRTSEFDAVLATLCTVIREAGGWAAFMGDHRPALRAVGDR